MVKTNTVYGPLTFKTMAYDVFEIMDLNQLCLKVITLNN